MVGDDVQSQFTQAMENTKKVLESENFTLNDVKKATVFVTVPP